MDVEVVQKALNCLLGSIQLIGIRKRTELGIQRHTRIFYVTHRYIELDKTVKLEESWFIMERVSDGINYWLWLYGY